MHTREDMWIICGTLLLVVLWLVGCTMIYKSNLNTKFDPQVGLNINASREQGVDDE